MNTILRRASLVLVAGLFGLVGCGESEPPSRPMSLPSQTKIEAPRKEPPPKVEKAEPPAKVAENPTEKPVGGSEVAKLEDPMEREKPLFKEPPAQEGWKRSKPLGENIWLETQGDKRRVLVAAVVCLREGAYGLECLLCKRGTKEHESLLVTTAHAKVIHAALEVAKIKAGSPVEYRPKFAPPRGDKVKVTLLYENKGKWVSVPGQKWIRNAKTKKDLEYDWVFAGSLLYKNPDDEDKNSPPIYLADGEGAYICISNVPTAMLDLPIDSPKGIENRVYEPHTANIPALDTSVTVILEPMEEKKK
jgi:hypothetical protein